MTNPFTEIADKLDQIQRQVSQKSPDPEWLNLDEACAYLNLGKSAVYKKTMNHELPFYKFGKKLMFKQCELSEFVTSHKAGGDPLPGVKIER